MRGATSHKEASEDGGEMAVFQQPTSEQVRHVSEYRTFRWCIVTTVILLLLFIAGFSGWQANVEYRLTIRSAELQSRSYARALREHAERAFGEADGLLLEVVNHIRRHGGMGHETSDHLRLFLKNYPHKLPQTYAVVLIDRHGKLFAHSLDIPVSTADSSDREFFIHYRDNPRDTSPFISKPFKSRLHDNWRFAITRPVHAADGSFDGVVAVGFYPEYFKSFYRSLELGSRGRITMMRTDGALLLAEPGQEKDYTRDFRKSFLFREHLPRSPQGTFHIKQGQALLEPDARIISYDSLVGFPVVVTANMGTREVTEVWRRNLYKHILVAGAACGALVILTLLLLRQIRRIERSHLRQEEQQAELVSSAAAWQTTFDSVADAIWVMGLDRRILRCNRASEEIFGRSNEEITGQLCCSVAHQGSEPLPTCPFQQMLDTRRRASMQISLNGRWLDISVDPIFGPEGHITGAVHIVSDITAIKEAEERYRLLVDNLPVVCWQADEAGNTHFVSRVVEQVEGYAPEELYGGGQGFWMERVHPDDLELVAGAYQALFREGAVYDVQYRIRHKQGHWVWLHDFAYATMLQDGTRVAHGVLSDVSARRQAEEERDQLEAQLRQAQKMEAIGHLAGGIAHDFNNLLTPILGYAEMAATTLEPDSPLIPRLRGIMAAAHKARDLTQQLLGFGRYQPMEATVIDLNDVIRSFNEILGRTIRENIRVEMRLDPQGGYINADRSRIEQIILNLTVNAQDAIAGPGTIEVATCRVAVDQEAARLHPGMAPGEYVLFTFRDTGCGMSAESMSHIFEPFFTTKPAGHGTGLGLATVYGIVKQHNAHIGVTSREGEGTTFRIYFSACSHCPLPGPASRVLSPDTPRSDLRVLVVEDNGMVREMVVGMLEGFGYRPLSAADPQTALELAETAGPFDLLVSDVVMPGMSGPELYEQLAIRMPDLRVVYISGYPITPGVRGVTVEDEINYLQKPFTAEALLERIRQAV